MLRQSHEEREALKRAAADAALEFVRDDDVVGLGTGSTVYYFLVGLGERVKAGLRVRGVPSSKVTAHFVKTLGIPLLQDDQDWTINVTVDGADQIDSKFNLIKGGGGALLREKIVAAASRRLIVIVDSEKCASILGHPVAVPVEVVPFGWQSTARLIRDHGWNSGIRLKDGEVFQTDGGHMILDVDIDRIENPAHVETQLNLIPGVVENGLFVGRTHTLIVGKEDGVQVQHVRTN